MYIKKIAIVFFVVALTGFYSTRAVQALDFADWSGKWFKIKVSETGKAGPVASVGSPDGGEVVTNNEKTAEAYLKIQSYETDGDPTDFQTYFLVGYCSFNGSVWLIQWEDYLPPNRRLTWPLIGGEPERFLTMFNFDRRQSQNIIEKYWVPLEIKGTDANDNVGEITSASFKNIGGIFLEEIGTPDVTQRGVGSIKFTGSFIKGTAVEVDVPEGCRISAPL